MHRLSLIAVAFVVSMSIAACGTDPPSSVADRTSRGLPDSYEVPVGAQGLPDPSVAATWIERGRRFAVITWGSSTCPLVPTTLAMDEQVTIGFESSDEDVCTADLGPTTHEFTVPDGAAPGPLGIVVTYADSNDQDTFSSRI